MLGTLTVDGDFVGVPRVSWLRVSASGGAPVPFVRDCSDEAARGHIITADDVGGRLRASVEGPFGGGAVSVDSEQVSVDPHTAAELAKMYRKGEATFKVKSVPGNEPRELLVNRDKVEIHPHGARHDNLTFIHTPPPPPCATR